jgi:hypothetical protein
VRFFFGGFDSKILKIFGIDFDMIFGGDFLQRGREGFFELVKNIEHGKFWILELRFEI